MSCNQQYYDQLLILIVYSEELSLSFHKLFHILFLLKQGIIHQKYPKHLSNYLFLSTIYKLIKVEVLDQQVLSNLEIIYVYLLRTININPNKHQLFSLKDQFHKLVKDENINLRTQFKLL